MTTTLAPAPSRATHSSWSSTDLPDPDLLQIAMLWLPAPFSNGDHQQSCTRRPTRRRWGQVRQRYSPSNREILAAVVENTVRLHKRRVGKESGRKLRLRGEENRIIK